jgi:hypothetical protein
VKYRRQFVVAVPSTVTDFEVEVHLPGNPHRDRSVRNPIHGGAAIGGHG